MSYQSVFLRNIRILKNTFGFLMIAAIVLSPAVPQVKGFMVSVKNL